ncbi:MAG: HD domain-containing protein [Actinomycetota bacterium]|nr:HD domain-containing protein [Actinomycetota bacterium]
MTRRALIATAFLVLGVGAVAVAAKAGIRLADLPEIGLFALSYALVSALPLRLSRGGVLQAGCGIAVASVLLLGMPAGVAAAGGGAILSFLLGMALERQSGLMLLDFSRIPLLVLGFGYAAEGLGFPQRLLEPSVPTMLVALVLAAAYVLADLASYAALWAFGEGEAVWSSVKSLVRLVGAMYLGQVSVGIVLAIVYPTMNVAGVAVLVTLMMVMKHAFALLLRIRTAYTQTVGVLARLAEFEKIEFSGHAERVAELATAMGRRLGLRPKHLQRLGFAALLHDIGKIQDSAGAHDCHWETGARIVEGVEFLADLGPVLANHHADFEVMQSTGVDRLLSQVIRVASDFDEFAGGYSAPQARAADVLGVIRAGSAEKYDPRVVGALERVLSAELD